MTTNQNPPTVPADWTCPAWLALYNRAELRYLCERLDASNREKRQTINQLRAMLERAPHDTERAILQNLADHYTEDPRR